MQLTEAGKVFYHEAQTVLRAYANMVDRTRAVDRPSSQIVRIGYLKKAAGVDSVKLADLPPEKLLLPESFLYAGLNELGDKLAILPIADVDSSFKVSAFYRNDLPSEVFAICKKGFEACSASMQSWDGFSLANID